MAGQNLTSSAINLKTCENPPIVEPQAIGRRKKEEHGYHRANLAVECQLQPKDSQRVPRFHSA